MKRILDIMFSNKKMSIFVPLCINIIMLLLCILLGVPASKIDTFLAGLVLSAFCFWGVFLILMVQVKISFCPDWFLNLFEFLITVVTVIYSIVGIVNFFKTGFKDFNFVICIGLTTYSSTALAHNKRNN